MPMPGARALVRSYNFGAVICTLGPLPLSNYGPEGGLEVEYPSDLLESELSADGFVTYSANMDERVRITVTVNQMSAALPSLQALWSTQTVAMYNGGLNTDGSPFEGFPFTMIDPATGDMIRAQALFMREPQLSKAKANGTRELMIELPYGRFRQTHGFRNAADALVNPIPGPNPDNV